MLIIHSWFLIFFIFFCSNTLVEIDISLFLHWISYVVRSVLSHLVLQHNLNFVLVFVLGIWILRHKSFIISLHSFLWVCLFDSFNRELFGKIVLYNFQVVFLHFTTASIWPYSYFFHSLNFFPLFRFIL